MRDAAKGFDRMSPAIAHKNNPTCESALKILADNGIDGRSKEKAVLFLTDRRGVITSVADLSSRDCPIRETLRNGSSLLREMSGFAASVIAVIKFILGM